MENSHRFYVATIDVDRASHAKHLRRKKHLEKKKSGND